jgi:hypothetical protein
LHVVFVELSDHSKWSGNMNEKTTPALLQGF